MRSIYLGKLNMNFLKSRTSLSLVLCTSLLALSACQTTQNAPMDAGDKQGKIDSALTRAASVALKSGNTEHALSILEKAYNRDNQNAEVATQYAMALRMSGKAEKASVILESFANASDASLATIQEFSSVQLETGEYELAEKFARKALEMDKDSSEAHHNLGIALDAQGKHEEAEKSFRTALDMWEGDPVPIMNNLALNLASQERVSDAVDILKKAKAIAPNRVEVERNLRIISTLNEDPKAFNAN